MKVNAMTAQVGTVIQFYVQDALDLGGYDLVREKDDWSCWHRGRRTEDAGGSRYSSEYIANRLAMGDWVATCVIHPYHGMTQEQIKAGTIQPDTVLKFHEEPKPIKKSKSYQKRAKALNKLGVTITLRKDGWAIFEADWCRLEISPEVADFGDVLSRAEATFGKD